MKFPKLSLRRKSAGAEEAAPPKARKARSKHWPVVLTGTVFAFGTLMAFGGYFANSAPFALIGFALLIGSGLAGAASSAN